MEGGSTSDSDAAVDRLVGIRPREDPHQPVVDICEAMRQSSEVDDTDRSTQAKIPQGNTAGLFAFRGQKPTVQRAELGI